ncbi:MAG: hypothetical protein J5X22_03045 [Candidatus Accumulibacter sp.]|uniref:hypothetical protein n=1 Tax=Accumulibacter sp. TaxID=2053492 RepID=UPI001B046565|nr:hypothetical protein [Accumulibacter sp.]MBO3709517.1 hypothetical protein [Accumulibacter sp.]
MLMTETAFNTSGTVRNAVHQIDIRSILQWLTSPAAPQPVDELPMLRSHLQALREVRVTPVQRAHALDRLYKRGMTVITRLLPSLTRDLVLPVPRKTRRIVNGVLNLLQMLADDMLALLEEPFLARPPELALWRSLQALSQQLLISHLIACPAPTGSWQQLHQTYARVRRLQVDTAVPRGASRKLQDVYYSAVLLGCAQPASLTPQEVLFLADYFERFADQVEPISTAVSATPATFWIDPARDVAACSALRNLSRPAAPLECFSCVRLCLLLRAQIAQLDAGTSASELNLPDFAGTSAGRGVLGRLATRWSDLGKRRYIRRRQNHRALLGTGIDGLWHIGKKEDPASVNVSTWMVTNESPEGYAVMHVTGNTGVLSVGNVVAIRTDFDQNWQICLVRWALSENPEHLELGLQILAPKAVPAILAQPSHDTGTEYLRVLILPEIPKLRSGQSLVVATGALPKERDKLLLLIEGNNISVREVSRTGIEEQTGSVEIMSIESVQNPF